MDFLSRPGITLLLLLTLCGTAAAQDETSTPDATAVPLEPVTALPPADAFTDADRQLRQLQESLPDFGPPVQDKPGLAGQILQSTLLPSAPPVVSDAAQLSAEEHLRNAGRSREQLP